MIDRFFSAALTFCLLAGGTLAIGSAWLESRPGASMVHKRVVQLPAVEMNIMQLPRVDVIGKRLDTGTKLARTEGTEPAASNTQ